MSLIGIDTIWRLSLVCLLMGIKASSLRYTGYLNFINDPISPLFIANSSSCTTTKSSIPLTSCLTAIKNHVIKYCTTVYERNGKKVFWSIKNSDEILKKNLKFFLHLVCLHMISLLCIPRCLII